MSSAAVSCDRAGVEAAGLEARYPAMTALAGDAHRFGDVGDGLAFDHDTLDKQSPAVERETSVTVSHEDLRFVKTAISTMPGGLLTPADRHQRHGRVHLDPSDARLGHVTTPVGRRCGLHAET